MQEQAIDLQFDLRSALWPSGDFGRILTCLREAETLAATLDDPRRLGQVSLMLSAISASWATYDQALAAAQRALALATAGGMSTCRQWRISASAMPTIPRATIGGRSIVSGRPSRPSETHSAASALVYPAACRALPCLARRVPCRVGHVRRGYGPRGRRAADCRGGGSPYKHHVCRLGMWSAVPPPGPPAQGAPHARTGRTHLSGRGPPAYSLRLARLGAAYTLRRTRRRCRATARTGDRTGDGDGTGKRPGAVSSRPRARPRRWPAVWRKRCAHAERALELARERQERGNEAYVLRLLGEIAAQRQSPEGEQAEAYYRQALALAR